MQGQRNTKRQPTTTFWGAVLLGLGTLASPGAVAVLGVAGLTQGCTEDRQYCDDTGCYYCDGLGCRPIDVVVPPVATCQFNHECGAGRVCLNQACAAMCDAERPCPTGQLCEEGICQDDPAVVPVSCMTSVDCDGGVCVEGACQASCTADEQCESGYYCADGGCVLDERPRPFCESDEQCMPGHPCVDGLCRTSCESSDECARFDMNLRFCIESYCRTTSEATANCERAADCEADEDCLDGVCR